MSRKIAYSNRQHRTAPLITLLIFTYLFTTEVQSETVLSSGNRQATLIELFTSQGCSSCPPAERWLGKLERDPRLWSEIIPVAFHVDYWDYIGWQDTYAKAEFSARQRRYRSDNSIGSVYTPGFVVNGKEWRGWFRNRNLPLANSRSGQLHVTLNDRQLTAIYDPAKQSNKPFVLHIALLASGLEVDVGRGENSGKRLPQDFTALDMTILSSPDGSWQTTLPKIRQPAGSRRAIAVWVSEGESQVPLQAVGSWLDNER